MNQTFPAYIAPGTLQRLRHDLRRSRSPGPNITIRNVLARAFIEIEHIGTRCSCRRPESSHARCTRVSQDRLRPSQKAPREREDLFPLDKLAQFLRTNKLREAKFNAPSIYAPRAIQFRHISSECLCHNPCATDHPRANDTPSDTRRRHPRIDNLTESLDIRRQVRHIVIRKLKARHRGLERVPSRIDAHRHRALQQPLIRRMLDNIWFGQRGPSNVGRNDAALRFAAPIMTMAVGARQDGSGIPASPAPSEAVIERLPRS